MKKINLAEKFNLFSELWSPKVVGQVDHLYVKLAKFKGEFIWHHHEKEDEFFLVVKGKLIMKFKEKELELGPGDCCFVPRGIEHCPLAEEEVHVVMIESKDICNTGQFKNEKTLKSLDKI